MEQNYLNTYSLLKISELYELPDKQLVFLDSEQNPVAVTKIERVPYTGKIYAVTVPNRILLIRRKNSTPVWCGNSNYDLQFLDLKCGENTLEYQWLNNSVFIQDYSCTETGYETSKVLTSGKHTLQFKFGSDVAYAYNAAGEQVNASYWNRTKKIVIHHEKVNGTLTNFPVLVKVTNADLKTTANSGHVEQTNGEDILFTNSSGTQLSHELESYNGTTGELIAWVKVPTLSDTSDTVLYVYYGNSTCADQQDVANVWDSNFKLVQHLQEDPSGSAPQMIDSTSNNNNGTPYGAMTSADQITGKIDGSLDFDTNDRIDCGRDTSLNFSQNQNFTLEAWISTSTSNKGRIVSKDSGSFYYLEHDGSGRITFYIKNSGSNYEVESPASPILNDGNWHHIAALRDGSTLRIYVDGSQVASTPSVTTAAIQPAANLSIASKSGSADFFGGKIDELRVSGTARSGEWIDTCFNNQNDTASFLSFGNTTIECTIVSVTPNDIEANSTGTFTAIINCTDPSGINTSRYLITKTVEGGLGAGPPNRWSIRPPVNNWSQSSLPLITEQILRSYNRGKGKWFDSYGIFTDNFSYGVHDGTAAHVNITSGLTWAKLNYTWNVETTAFRNMFFLVRTALESEDKANKKEYNVYKNNPLLVLTEK
jgi:archaellum component FlaG (FlaF/FlaG flagellin family)